MPEIDLSALPPPEVVEPLDFETILAEIAADYVRRYPEFSAYVESEPALKLLETAAYREMVVRWRINEAAKSVMAAFAKGANLDHLVALAGVRRMEGESDERLLRRYLLSLEALSVAGPRGAYEFHALSADARVVSAHVTTPNPGDIRIVVVGGDDPDGLPDAALIAKIVAALSDELVRPLSDTVEVLAARNVCYQVAVTVHVEQGPDRELVRAAAEREVRAYLLSRHLVGAAVHKSAITGAAQVPGVTHSSVAFSWAPGTAYAAEALDVADLALPAAWQPVAAFWPALPDSIEGDTVDLGGGRSGYLNPSTAPADGLTVRAP